MKILIFKIFNDATLAGIFISATSIYYSTKKSFTYRGTTFDREGWPQRYWLVVLTPIVVGTILIIYGLYKTFFQSAQ